MAAVAAGSDSTWSWGVLHLLEHKLHLGNLVVPSTTAQEAEQGIIDSQSLLLLTQLPMRLRSFLAELHQLIGFFSCQRIQIDTIDGFIKVHGRGAQIASGAIALTKRIVAGECIIRIVEQASETDE